RRLRPVGRPGRWPHRILNRGETAVPAARLGRRDAPRPRSRVRRGRGTAPTSWNLPKDEVETVVGMVGPRGGEAVPGGFLTAVKRPSALDVGDDSVGDLELVENAERLGEPGPRPFLGPRSVDLHRGAVVAEPDVGVARCALPFGGLQPGQLRSRRRVLGRRLDETGAEVD